MVTKVAIGQCRVSKGDNGIIENSLESQRREIIQFATHKLGITEDEIEWCIEEKARSSYDEDADWSKFDDSINKAIETSSIKFFISYAQDRFCRNSKKSKMYKQLLLQGGVTVRFVHGDIEDPNSDSGFIQDSLQEMISEWYSRKIANETLRGCKENARTRDPESGYVYQNGGSAPFWLKPYKLLKVKDTQGTPFYRTYWAENTDIYSAKINGEVVSKTMWEWGKFIFLELRLRQAKSYKDIADFANAIKLPISRKSKLARKNTLSLQAKHEILYGTVIYNKHHYNNNYKKGSLKLQEEWVIVENGVPALMTKEEFDLLQDMNNQKARKKDSTSSNSKNEKLLVDMPDKFYCASCGSKIISSGKHYVCSEYNSHGRQGCKAKSFYLPSDWLDDKVQKEIIKLYLNDDVIQTLYENYVLAKNKQKIELNNNKQEATILQKEIKSKERNANKLMDNITSGNVEGLALKAMSEKYNAIQEEITNLKVTLANIETPKISRVLTLDYFRSMCKKNSRILAQSLLVQRRAFIKKCIEAVILDPIRREVHIKLDISPFLMKNDDVKTAKKLEVSEFDTSSEMVAGAGFEPTTFGL